MDLENHLILEICNFQNPRKAIIEDGLKHCGSSADLLGKLLIHRMGGVAYDVLRRCESLGAVNREIRNTLHDIYTVNSIKNESYRMSLKHLADCLKDVTAPYAVLKGAYLAEKYPTGYRTSNDIDLLLAPDQVSEVGSRLESAGFRQGYVRNGAFRPASRAEIINACMNRGETVPYILQVDFPFMQFLEVDLNFSLDYKPSDGKTVEDMLKTLTRTSSGLNTLSKEDFFIHLCAHLYKEATTYAWVEMGRDLSLYKFADIYLLASEYTDEDYKNLEKRIHALKMEKECAYAMFGTYLLFPIKDENFILLSEKLYNNSENCLDEVIDPAKAKVYRYTMDFGTRFFNNDRKNDLKEVGKLGAAAYV